MVDGRIVGAAGAEFWGLCAAVDEKRGGFRGWGSACRAVSAGGGARGNAGGSRGVRGGIRGGDQIGLHAAVVGGDFDTVRDRRGDIGICGLSVSGDAGVDPSAIF